MLKFKWERDEHGDSLLVAHMLPHLQLPPRQNQLLPLPHPHHRQRSPVVSQKLFAFPHRRPRPRRLDLLALVVGPAQAQIYDETFSGRE